MSLFSSLFWEGRLGDDTGRSFAKQNEYRREGVQFPAGNIDPCPEQKRIMNRCGAASGT